MLRSKPTSFRVGETVEARVHESLGDGDVIVSFSGDLLRLANRTGRSFREGDRVELEVTSENPLSFRLKAPRRLSRGMDVRI